MLGPRDCVDFQGLTKHILHYVITTSQRMEGGGVKLSRRCDPDQLRLIQTCSNQLRQAQTGFDWFEPVQTGCGQSRLVKACLDGFRLVQTPSDWLRPVQTGVQTPKPMMSYGHMLEIQILGSHPRLPSRQCGSSEEPRV